MAPSPTTSSTSRARLRAMAQRNPEADELDPVLRAVMQAPVGDALSEQELAACLAAEGELLAGQGIPGPEVSAALADRNRSE